MNKTLVISVITWFVIVFLTSGALQLGHRDWTPIKPGLLEPKDFRAFFTQPVGCQVELIFSRDVNDLTYEYDAYCVYDDGYQYYLLPLNLNNRTTPLAINSADPYGQRGAFLLPTNYTLTPIIVDICRIGLDNPDFDFKYEIVKPTTFIIRAIPNGSERSSEKIGESWWESGPFHLHQYPLTPQDGGIYNLTAIAYKPDPKVEIWHANISWQSILQSSDIDSFFILTGPSHDADSIQSIQIMDANATNASIRLNQFDPKVNYDVAIAVYTTAGALTSPFDVPQIHIQSV